METLYLVLSGLQSQCIRPSTSTHFDFRQKADVTSVNVNHTRICRPNTMNSAAELQQAIVAGGDLNQHSTVHTPFEATSVPSTTDKTGILPGVCPVGSVCAETSGHNRNVGNQSVFAAFG